MNKINSLLLSKEIYPYCAVKFAAKQFSDIADITVSRQGDLIKCSFKMLQNISIDIVQAEFENYVIDFVNSEKFYDVD